MTKFLNLAIGGAMLLAPLTAVHADETSIAVRYTGVDIGSPSGMKVLKRRINIAASRICGTADVRDLVLLAAVRRCMVATVASTDDQVRLALASRRDASFASVR